ncbi:ATP-binding domain-containing protein [Marinobacter alkaliphilus]|uniref:ATP-binding domain-containing protein n=1 Tax=Marinobacter alkaliphilus TaxID=254719 RepID=UPI003D8121E4|nr:ATP-binding domain-containing protein [Marinobacter alkaliphilus]
MSLQDHLTILAEDTLDIFSRVEAAAKEKIATTTEVGTSALAHTNTFTGTKTNQTLDKINSEARDGYYRLTREPAIARILLEDDKGEQKTVYVARKYQVSLGERGNLASYNAPMGRLASLPVGDSASVNGTEYTVLETCQLHPSQVAGEWDSKDSRFDHEDLGQQSISSLRALLRGIDSTAADDFEAMLAGGEAEEVIRKGLAHEIRRTMGLRDQPILDQFQDEIFRLPLNHRLMIMGPPGTGKTTTLIKRLSQKLDSQFLDDSEKQYALPDAAGREHSKSWIMFTPTDLLKAYLKEAFAREDVPVTNDDIVTWENYSRKLSRQNLGLLQSSTSSGKFILKSGLDCVKMSVIEAPSHWYEAFRDHHFSRLFTQLSEGLTILGNAEQRVKPELLSSLRNALPPNNPKLLLTVLRELVRLEPTIQEALQALNQESEKQLKELGLKQYTEDKRFFQDLATFVDKMDIDEEEDEDDATFDGEEESDEVDEIPTSKTDNKQAFDIYKKAIRSLARSRYQKKTLPKRGRTYSIINWLGDRIPTDEELQMVGERAAIRNALNRFNRAYRRYTLDVPASYKAFRKASLSKDMFYERAPEKVKHLSQYELDAVVLLTLETARSLLTDPIISRSNNGSQPTALQNYSTMFLNQVFVDEATDFSAIQLAAMRNLSSLNAQSFFACGDLNQRITGTGLRSQEQLKWVSPDIIVKKIKSVYRQSLRLNRLASELLALSGGDLSALGELPPTVGHEGLKPALVERCCNLEDVSNWLADRIREIEHLSPPLPTTAVLVQSEELVGPMAEALNQRLENYNLRADACRDGKSLGEGNNVRVFSIEHIKGLEFEAVFFVSVDELAKQKPDLFDKYLYVGMTRAATYLGMTSNGDLPEPLNRLRNEFVQNWM